MSACEGCVDIGGTAYKYTKANGKELVFEAGGTRVVDNAIIVQVRSKFNACDVIDCSVYEAQTAAAVTPADDPTAQLLGVGVATDPDDPTGVDVPVVAMLQPDTTITYINMNTGAPYTMVAPFEFRKDTQVTVHEESGCVYDAVGDLVRQADRVTVRDEDGDLVSRTFADPITGLASPLIATETWGDCASVGDASFTVYVVRLDGDATGASAPRVEGTALTGADVGNTFTLGGAGQWPEYASYSAIWLGDTAQDSFLDWNDISYVAGSGSGSAGYLHSSLPQLTDGGTEERHTSNITLFAQPGAKVEFRFKVAN